MLLPCDFVKVAEGSMLVPQERPGASSPSGSKSGACTQGLPRNLGDLVLSTEGKAARATGRATKKTVV